MKKKSTTAVDDLVERYADAILEHLQWGVVRGGKKGKHHIIADKMTLCHMSGPFIPKQTPVLYTDRCKECNMELARLVTLVSANSSRYAFTAMNGEIAVSASEVKAALAALDEDEVEQIAYDKLMLPEEMLPTGTGQLLQRGW